MITSDADILARLGQPGAILLGAGNEARVYRLDHGRVARIMRSGALMADAEARASLLAEISAAPSLRFRTPQLEQLMDIEGRVVSIEKLLEGEPVSTLLGTLNGPERTGLVADYLDCARAISTIRMRREFYGPLLGEAGLRAADWNGFLRARLARSRALCPADLGAAVEAVMQISLPEPDRPALVHLDYFPGNVLARHNRISAVLDFGPSSIIGDARMEAWSAVAYLDEELSPQANNADRAQALEWLAKQSLMPDYQRARRWLAAYWSFATDDIGLMEWCRKILLHEPA